MSPVVFRHRGYRFLFYANEGTPREPPHIHVIKDHIDAKFWLWPDVSLAYNDGFDARIVRKLIPIIEAQRGTIERAWNDFFGEAD
ncbi:DUF4160 domain-containing protein [Devosia sp.]|uniref:DUF4160 domain-containing protein n=1 Tax=Devosia sp. TaxID=1871048 RepID=UPI001AC27B3C|nr:DUF4160 domain-containing protein [Devosia sp.]MBN9309501.1 DUF4160 domain-containing protein [Devosia sp.]